MCLAIPGKVVEIDPQSSPVMGKVDFSGIQRRVCLDWISDIAIGDYVIVHVGFAIARMDEAEDFFALTCTIGHHGEKSSCTRGFTRSDRPVGGGVQRADDGIAGRAAARTSGRRAVT